MATRTKYIYLEERADKKTKEPFIKNTGIRASTIWHDRYVSRIQPDRIARDRDLPSEAVYEALNFCQENWELIYEEKEREKSFLKKVGFFEETA